MLTLYQLERKEIRKILPFWKKKERLFAAKVRKSV